MAWTPNQFRLTGGLNEEDPPFTQKPGFLAHCQNYECLAGGGYRRIEGYERFDGSTHATGLGNGAGGVVQRPSTALYYYLRFRLGHNTMPVVGNTITGGTSGATAILVGTVPVTVASGTFGAGTAIGHMGYTNVVGGPFVNGEVITATNGGIVTRQDVSPDTITTADLTNWLAGAREYYRSLISGPAGSGPILGGFVLNGNNYCWRRNAGDTASILYKATTVGWVVVALSYYLRFSTGTVAVTEGQTINGLVSGATAVVLRVGVGVGNYAGPTFASGRFAIGTITGTFQNGEVIQVGVTAVAVAVGTQTITTLPAGGGIYPKIESLVHNFYGASYSRRAYGCDGYNRAWEFDGTVFISIETGMTTDTPTFIAAHRNYLFLSFTGGSLQNSATGLPLTWSVRLGADELGIGDEITGLATNGNNMLAITSLQTTSILQGTSNLDWVLRSITNDIGSVAYTIQEAGGQTMFLDRAGVNVVIPAPFTYQDVSTQAISRNVRKTIELYAPNAIDSVHVIKKNQYRVFFDTGTVLTATFFGTKLMGWMKSVYPRIFGTSWCGQDANGVEHTYGGTGEATNAFVMELDSGTSFDGTAIVSILQLQPNYCGSPNRDKRFHKLTVELETPAQIDLTVALDFDYNAVGQAPEFSNTALLGGPTWTPGSWEALLWDVGILTRAELNIDGIGASISTAIMHSSTTDDAFTVSAAMLQYTPLGIKT